MGINTKEVIRKYRDAKRPAFEALASRVAELLQSILNEADVPIAHIEHRAKTPESLERKLTTKKYGDPFVDITDFAGVRVITYYQDDVNRVAQIIHAEFNVDPDHSVDKQEEMDVDEFGYRSFHLVCALSGPRKALPEWKRFGELPVEIQVRSVLQHAWAAISHKLDYKSTSQAPRQLRRQLFRLSALLELADDEFAQIRDRSQTISRTYSRDVAAGEFDIPLNIDSLSTYLLEKADLPSWQKRGIKAGMLQPSNWSMSEDVSCLFEILRAIRVKTIQEFKQLLEENASRSEGILRRVASEVRKRGLDFEAAPIDVITMLLAVAECSRLPPDFRWPWPWYNDIREAMDVLCHRIGKA